MAFVRINPEALRRIREESGHTQSSLARQCDVAQTRISALERLDERGEPRDVRPPTAKRLADALGVAITDITSPEPSPVEATS